MTVEFNYTYARDHLAAVCDAVVENREVAVVHRRGNEDIALIAVDELNGLLETAHLMRSPANASRLFAALDRAMNHEGSISSIEELERNLGLVSQKTEGLAGRVL